MARKPTDKQLFKMKIDTPEMGCYILIKKVKKLH